RSGGLDVDVPLSGHGVLGGAGARVQHPAFGHDGERGRPHRGAVYLSRALDRFSLGKTHLGHLVGVGRAADFGADSALSLFRLHGSPGGDRRSSPRRQGRAVLALVGVVNIPIIYFSVKWWNTLHQGASVSLTKAPTMAATMLTG